MRNAVIMLNATAGRYERILRTLVYLDWAFQEDDRPTAWDIRSFWQRSGGEPRPEEIRQILEISEVTTGLTKSICEPFGLAGMPKETVRRLLRKSLLLEARVNTEKVMRSVGTFKTAALLDHNVERVQAIISTGLVAWQDLRCTESQLLNRAGEHRSYAEQYWITDSRPA